MGVYVTASDPETLMGSLLRAVLALHHNDFDRAAALIDASRRLLVPLLTPLVKEGYNRAYKLIVHLQQLSEMEEILACVSIIDP